jgi:23S rRNA pseudouridine1911/1915/1917 synthase
LDIVYEDEDVIIVNKAAGMVVHPSIGHNRGTLVHAVLAHAPDIEGVGGERRPGLVHRLDKDTSGLIVLAKNDRSHRFIQGQFKDRKVDKYYISLVDNAPPTPSGRVETPIGRDPRNRQRMAVTTGNKGRLAISEYKTLEQFNQHTLLQVHILTGRTHQIRVQMAFIKCPVVGDNIYGKRHATLDVSRQMLHAGTIGLVLPSDKKKHVFTAPLPIDFQYILNQLRGIT